MVYECEEVYGEITIQRVGLFENYQAIEDILTFKQLKLMPTFSKIPVSNIYQPNFLHLSEVINRQLRFILILT